MKERRKGFRHCGFGKPSADGRRLWFHRYFDEYGYETDDIPDTSFPVVFQSPNWNIKFSCKAFRGGKAMMMGRSFISYPENGLVFCLSLLSSVGSILFAMLFVKIFFLSLNKPALFPFYVYLIGKFVKKNTHIRLYGKVMIVNGGGLSGSFEVRIRFIKPCFSIWSAGL
jgi:hypothetical protein